MTAQFSATRANIQPSVSKKFNATLWGVQTLLALLFLFAGSMKFILPIEAMTKQIPLPGAFLHFIGIAEILGAIGLVAPGLFRIRQELTPLAAYGLIVIMIGATVLTYLTGGLAQAVMPFCVGLLLLLVARGRRFAFHSRGREVASLSLPRIGVTQIN